MYESVVSTNADDYWIYVGEPAAREGFQVFGIENDCKDKKMPFAKELWANWMLLDQQWKIKATGNTCGGTAYTLFTRKQATSASAQSYYALQLP